jgi:putative NADPH-quinone reductase
MVADAYEAGAKEAGHEIVRMNIGEMHFDPVLHKGYRAVQELEPDLKLFSDRVKWADHFVVIHPVWWVGMPAILKGLFDRAWLPGSEFRYIKLPSGKRTPFWHRLMRGKTARIIIASGTHPWLVRLLPGNVNAQLRWGILWFAGFRVRTTWYGPSENVPEPRKQRWLKNIRELGRGGR